MCAGQAGHATKEVITMKKLLALLLVLCLSLTVVSVLAEEEYEEDEIGYYPDEYPESRPYINTWVAEDGDWRIEVYGEDGGIKPMVIHRLDGKEDIWEYAMAAVSRYSFLPSILAAAEKVQRILAFRMAPFSAQSTGLPCPSIRPRKPPAGSVILSIQNGRMFLSNSFRKLFLSNCCIAI